MFTILLERVYVRCYYIASFNLFLISERFHWCVGLSFGCFSFCSANFMHVPMAFFVNESLSFGLLHFPLLWHLIPIFNHACNVWLQDAFPLPILFVSTCNTAVPNLLFGWVWSMLASQIFKTTFFHMASSVRMDVSLSATLLPFLTFIRHFPFVVFFYVSRCSVITVFRELSF